MVPRSRGSGGAALTRRVPPWAIAALLISAGVSLYWPVFHLTPFEEDNVYALAWAASTPAARVVAVDAFYYPEWRPLAYATVWIEQRLEVPMAFRFGVNLALWIACAGLAHRIVRRLVDSEAAALLAAFLVLTDPRATWTLVAIIERQTSLACVFGLSAVLVSLPIERRLSRLRQVGLAALLVASILSKEYGAAFALTFVAYGLLQRRRDLWQPALVAAAGYVTLRLITVGAIVQPYCEEMYLFGTAREVCLDVTQPAGFAQIAYNAAATLVNLPLLGLLSGTGAPIFAESRLVTGVVFTALAVLAVAKGPRLSRMIAITVIANAALSVMIYRDRNQLAGACALAMLAGMGWPLATRLLSNRVARIAVAAVIVALLGAQAALARALVVERGAIAAQIDPCRLEIMERDFVPPYVAWLTAQYRPGSPNCDGRD